MDIDNAVKELKYKGRTIAVYQDGSSPESPRDWDNLGTMLCLHTRYNLGDKHDLSSKAIQRIVEGKDVIALPVYLYDHSGITIRTIPFNCRWDSGLVGYIYVTKATVCAEFSCKRVSSKRADKVRAILKSEIETYDLFLTGQCYGYEVTDEDGDCIDNCWGFFTDDIDTLLQEGKDMVDNL